LRVKEDVKMEYSLGSLYTNKYSEKDAIRYLSGQQMHALSFGQLSSMAQRLANHFAGQESPVLSMFPNCAEWDIIDYACYLSGTPHIALHPLIDKELLGTIIAQTSPSFIFLYYNFNIRAVKEILSKSMLASRLVGLHTHSDITDFYELINSESIGQNAKNFLPSDLQTIIYTSGSSGLAKGVMLSKKNIESAAASFSQAHFFDGCETALSILPISLSGERKLNYAYKLRGITICYPSALQSLANALTFFRPQILAVVPYLLEKIKNLIIDKEVELDFMKAIVCGGASIPIKTLDFFDSIGLPVYELYGLTETASLLSFNDKGFVKNGTVGRVAPGITVKLIDDGEILCKGENVTSGYFNQPELSKQLFDEGGWLRTGDLGELDNDGYLTITGRKKSIYKNSRGVYVLPEKLERKIKEHPLVTNTVVFGENMEFNKAILFTGPAEQTEGMKHQMRNWILECNALFREEEKIDGFYILPQKPWEDAAPMTASMKVKRAEISRLISGKEQISVY
jgi:long-chain acyl-CoA synthetase